jgi:serine O-acetyltransferase
VKLLSNWIDDLFEWFFCINPKYRSFPAFVATEEELKSTINQLIKQSTAQNECVKTNAQWLFERLKVVHSYLMSDLDAIFEADPAAKSLTEILVSYPGFYAVTVHRIAHELWQMNIPILPRMLTEYAHGRTGIDIHPGAKIGKRFLIDHGTGIVIGETCIIGNDVKIYQGVTLGALSVSRNLATIKRHPTIGDRVTIYANATILGGNTTIGNDSTIGGNVWITQSIPSNSLVYHKSEIVIKQNSNFPEPLNFII